MKFEVQTREDGRRMAWNFISGLLTPEEYRVIMQNRGYCTYYEDELFTTLIRHARNDPAVKARLEKRKTPVKPIIVFCDDDDENPAD